MSRFVEEDLPLVRAVEGDAPPLKPVGVRLPLFTYIKQLWGRRHFLRKQAWALAMNQHQDSLLGNLWLIIAPLMNGFIYFLIFGVMFSGARQGIDNFFGYLIIGIFLFTFTTRSLIGCTTAIMSNRGLIRAFSFPRASLPIAVIMREFIALGPVLYALVMLILIVPPRATLGWYWLLFPFVVMLQALINLGLGFILARWGSAFQDVKQLMSYAIRFLMYGSCVMWTIDRFEAFPDPIPQIARENPFFLILDTARSLLLDNTLPPSEHWVKLSVWAGASLVIGFIYFWQGEVSYARRAHE